MIEFLLIPLVLILILSGGEERQISGVSHQNNQQNFANNNNRYENLSLNANNSHHQDHGIHLVSSSSSSQRGHTSTTHNDVQYDIGRNNSSSTKEVRNKSIIAFPSSNGKEKEDSKHEATRKDSKEKNSTLSLHVLAYENLNPNGNFVYENESENEKEQKIASQGCFDKIWHGFKSVFGCRQNAIAEGLNDDPSEPEVRPFAASEKLVDFPERRVLRNTAQNTVYLPTISIPYIRELVTYFRSGTCWKSITQHFQPGQWLGEDDLTNLIRLTGATHRFSQKFAWVTVEAMSMTFANFNYHQTLENFVEKTNEIVFIPCCIGGHFTVWVYYRLKNKLQYYDPQNNNPSVLIQQRIQKIIKILFNPQVLPSTSSTLVNIPESMKQHDSFNCGIITFDIILRLMDIIPYFEDKYNPNNNRKKYFMLFKEVYASNIIRHSYLNNTPKITPIPPFPLPSNKESDDDFIPEVVNEINSKVKQIPPSDAKKNVKQEQNEPIKAEPRKRKANHVKARKLRFANLASSGNKKKHDISVPKKNSEFQKVQKVKKLKLENNENQKSEWHKELHSKRYTGLHKKKEIVENKLTEARKKIVKKVDFVNGKSDDFIPENDFDYPENDIGMDCTESPTSSQINEKREPDMIITRLLSRARSPSPQLKYTPRVSNKLPNSFWRSKKRLEHQIGELYPGYTAKIILLPKEKNTANVTEEMIDLKVGGKLKKTQVERMSKVLKTPSYPTIMKKINAMIPDIPDVPAKNIDGRSNLIFKDFYSFVVARIQNSNKLPKTGPIRISSQADSGDDRTLFTFNFVDVENPNSPNNQACFAMFDGQDKRELITDICENVNIGAERLQREGIVVNGIRREVICFLNGDLKIRCEFCGCQGGSAKKFCCKCKTESYKTLGELRTIKEITQNSDDLQAEYLAGKQNPHRYTKLKQKYNSVNGPPLIPNIPLTRVIPPPLHILMALLNKFLFFIMCKEIKEFLKGINIYTTPGRSEFNGNACRKILQKIYQDSSSYTGPHQDIFILIAKVQHFAEARPLTSDEIDELERLIDDLFEKLDSFGNFSDGIKLHDLRFHLIPFLREHGSWGLFSEQGLEALHHIFNVYRAKIIAKESDIKKNNYAFYTHMQLIFVMKM